MKGKFWHGLKVWLSSAISAQNALPCVGIVVMAGCVTFLIAPDELPSSPAGENGSGQGFPMIVIDPGHGGKDDGARGNGLVEKDLTLDLAQRTARLLKVAGFPTKLTREDDTFISLERRARIANSYNDALFVSIHFNKDGDSSSTGIETFFARDKVPLEYEWTWVGFFSKPDQPSDRGENLAGAIQACLAIRTEAKNRGIRGRDLYVVRHTRCPAVLVEGGFMSNVFEGQLLKSNEYRERLAMGIAEGVMTYYKSLPRSAPNSQPRLAQLDR